MWNGFGLAAVVIVKNCEIEFRECASARRPGLLNDALELRAIAPRLHVLGGDLVADPGSPAASRRDPSLYSG